MHSSLCIMHSTTNTNLVFENYNSSMFFGKFLKCIFEGFCIEKHQQTIMHS